jgi:hypothetical protein
VDAIDPLRGVPGQSMPITDEVALQLKAKIRQAKLETTDPTARLGDVSELSPEAARLSKPQFEAFLESASHEIATLDRHSETFLSDATQRLIQQALSQKFGEQFLDDPGYSAMEAKLSQFILNDPESRSMVENMLGLLGESTPS